MSVKKASELAEELLNPIEDKEQVKKTTGDLANELDLFSEIDPSAKPDPKPAAKSAVKPVIKPAAKPLDLTSVVSSAVTNAVNESRNIAGISETVSSSDNASEPAAPAAATTSPAAVSPAPAASAVSPAAVQKKKSEDVLEGVDDIVEPESVTDNIIHYTAEDKKRLLRDLGAEVEFGIPQEGKETIIRNGPKRFEPGEEALVGQTPPPEAAKPKVRYKRRKKVLDIDEKKSLITTVVGLVVVAVLVYLGLGFYVHTTNNQAFEDIIKAIDPPNLTQVIDISVPDPSVKTAEKNSYGLSVYLVDSDNDGLSDHFELDRGYAPALSDTDGDGMPDGAEFLAGTDPRSVSTNGIENDSAREYSYDIELGEASLSVSGSWLIYEADLTEYPISFTNRPGVVGGVYEVVLPAGIPSANISFDLSRLDTSKWSGDTAFAIYSYNAEDGKFKKLSSTSEGDIISAVAGSGVYFAAADGVITDNPGLNIMFVIDNSGSMYSSDLVDGSEENDLEFRRLDFAEDLIDKMGETANFGVSKFTLSYHLLAAISEDDDAAHNALETIRKGSENWDGTEISQSIISAVKQFEDHPADRNFIIVITDGLPTNYNRDNETRAIDICKENNISIITIGLGKKIDSQFLSEAAENTGGVYYQAVNNSSFESITDKIAEFLSADRNTKAPQMPDNGESESASAVDVIMLADSGFSIEEDGLSFADIATSDDKNGSDLGVAFINKYYYAGILPLTASPYTANDRSEISGYSLAESEFFASGKANLSEYELPSVLAYGRYAAVKTKWDFNNITDGVAPLSKDALAAATDDLFGYVNFPYSYDGSSSSAPVLRAITFRHNTPFSEYTAAVIDTSKLSGEEQQVYAAINYYNNFNQKPGVYMYSFGVNGKTAFEKLQSELTLGRPSVLVADGRVYNAAKLSRMRNDGTSFIIEAYDPASKSTSPVYIYLHATRLLDGSGGFQYTASMNKSDTDIGLYLIQNTGE
jgi:hypothetical protein